MRAFRSETVAGQLAAHLRMEMEAQTGANRKTVESALRILERDGSPPHGRKARSSS